MLYTTPTMTLLEHAIDVSAQRQSVHAANIANANVEGYTRLEVSFDAALERANLQTSSSPAVSSTPALETAMLVNTGEIVKLDEEVAAMAKNALRYQILLGAFERSLGSIRLAINEGRS
jgi:flagellar basal-body rod protein FlgB